MSIELIHWFCNNYRQKINTNGKKLFFAIKTKLSIFVLRHNGKYSLVQLPQHIMCLLIDHHSNIHTIQIILWKLTFIWKVWQNILWWCVFDWVYVCVRLCVWWLSWKILYFHCWLKLICIFVCLTLFERQITESRIRFELLMVMGRANWNVCKMNYLPMAHYLAHEFLMKACMPSFQHKFFNAQSLWHQIKGKFYRI